MQRRDFLYTLAVFPGAAQGQTSAQPIDITNEIRRKMDALVPDEPSRSPGREPHMTQVDMEADVLVAGGGVAGVCAAVAAARNGARVILMQDRSRLGGNSSSEVKMHIVGADSHRGRPGWRESGLIEEFRLDDAANNPQRCWELWDLLLYDKVVSEPNIRLLLETTLFSVEMKGRSIQRAWARCDKSEQMYRIDAKMFVDATGDSRLGLEAGADMRTGREARSEFNESLAPEKPDQETLGSSILFTSKLNRRAMPFKAPAWARKVTKEQLKFRKVGPENWEYGYWWIEWGGDKDIIRDNERIRFELLSIVLGVWDYIKNSGDYPDSANYALDWVGMMPGKRGSRRLIGDHLLTQHDLLGTTFADSVAIGGWPMDDHPPGGFDRADLPPNTVIRTPEVYEIPLRSLYSKNVPNLMMAGRNISATYAAFTSSRVMATCAVIGQAVGTAAAQCVERGIAPRQLASDKKLVSDLRQRLLRDDQTIKNARNEDHLDLARTSKVTASAEEPQAKAALLLDGMVRNIPNKKGDPQEWHCWSAPMTGDGAWIELTWDQPKRLRRIQITFDSGFQRQLMLTASDSHTRTVMRQPQPETVKDYDVEYIDAGGVRRQLKQVKDNHQRMNRHTFDPVEAKSVRVHVKATNGLESARIFEVRCYA
ncbi:MAG TPA: FAD-dependent oxidoreductase [Bryobacteraceae bacterium]|nr:FAD-dependent oxidoreductase [Bryobacteraceae bacterium]